MKVVQKCYIWGEDYILGLAFEVEITKHICVYELHILINK
jgi:hypothetical protein